jgi:hypothetical protein
LGRGLSSPSLVSLFTAVLLNPSPPTAPNLFFSVLYATGGTNECDWETTGSAGFYSLSALRAQPLLSLFYYFFSYTLAYELYGWLVAGWSRFDPILKPENPPIGLSDYYSTAPVAVEAGPLDLNVHLVFE